MYYTCNLENFGLELLVIEYLGVMQTTYALKSVVLRTNIEYNTHPYLTNKETSPEAHSCTWD